MCAPFWRSELSRVEQHRAETKAKRIFRDAIEDYKEPKLHITDVVYRDITERDYGLDGLIEIFEDNKPTGKIAFLQFKGTEFKIEKLKKSDFVSCSNISKSNLSYCKQENNPVILIYASTLDGEFYFIDLQSVLSDMKLNDDENGTVTVRIPYSNDSRNLIHLFDIINKYYPKEDYDLMPKTEYTVGINDRVVDGKHRKVDREGNLFSEGLFEDDKLVEGIECNWLIRVSNGALIYKENCSEGPYDFTEDFEYEKYLQYGKDSLVPFFMCDNYFEEYGLECFFVVDLQVSDKYEQMINIRTMEQFLGEKKFNKLKKRITNVS